MLSYQEQRPGESLFVIRPNASMEWAGLKCLFGVMGLSVTAVAAYCASLGAWWVLPFAGLEMLVLGAGIYASARWAATREVIEITEQGLRISRGRRGPVEVVELPRHWTRATLVEDPRGWYPSRLLLVCHGRGYEIGRPLVEAERLRLATALSAKLSFRPDPAILKAARMPEGLDPASDTV